MRKSGPKKQPKTSTLSPSTNKNVQKKRPNKKATSTVAKRRVTSIMGKAQSPRIHQQAQEQLHTNRNNSKILPPHLEGGTMRLASISTPPLHHLNHQSVASMIAIPQPKSLLRGIHTHSRAFNRTVPLHSLPDPKWTDVRGATAPTTRGKTPGVEDEATTTGTCSVIFGDCLGDEAQVAAEHGRKPAEATTTHGSTINGGPMRQTPNPMNPGAMNNSTKRQFSSHNLDKTMANMPHDKTMGKMTHDKTMANMTNDKTMGNKTHDKTMANMAHNKTMASKNDTISAEMAGGQTTANLAEFASHDDHAKTMRNTTHDKTTANMAHDKTTANMAHDKTTANMAHDKTMRNMTGTHDDSRPGRSKSQPKNTFQMADSAQSDPAWATLDHLPGTRANVTHNSPPHTSTTASTKDDGPLHHSKRANSNTSRPLRDDDYLKQGQNWSGVVGDSTVDDSQLGLRAKTASPSMSPISPMATMASKAAEATNHPSSTHPTAPLSSPMPSTPSSTANPSSTHKLNTTPKRQFAQRSSLSKHGDIRLSGTWSGVYGDSLGDDSQLGKDRGRYSSSERMQTASAPQHQNFAQQTTSTPQSQYAQQTTSSIQTPSVSRSQAAASLSTSSAVSSNNANIAYKHDDPTPDQKRKFSTQATGSGFVMKDSNQTPKTETASTSQTTSRSQHSSSYETPKTETASTSQATSRSQHPSQSSRQQQTPASENVGWAEANQHVSGVPKAERSRTDQSPQSKNSIPFWSRRTITTTINPTTTRSFAKYDGFDYNRDFSTQLKQMSHFSTHLVEGANNQNQAPPQRHSGASGAGNTESWKSAVPLSQTHNPHPETQLTGESNETNRESNKQPRESNEKNRESSETNRSNPRHQTFDLPRPQSSEPNMSTGPAAYDGHKSPLH